MIPIEWNSRKEAINTQLTNGHVKDMMQEKEMILDGWNSKKEAINNQNYIGAIEQKEIIPGG